MTALAAGRTYRWLLLGLALGGLAADQASKYWMFHTLYDGTLRGEREVVPGWFRFTAEFDPATEPSAGFVRTLQLASAPMLPRVNHGALFGLGGGHKGTANLIFAGISLVAALGICIWGLRTANAQDRWLSLALGLILGGTIGNLYDRLVFGGVRDFLYFYKIDWPVFNVADCCLVVGAGLLLIHAFFSPAPARPAPAAGGESAAPPVESAARQ